MTGVGLLATLVLGAITAVSAVETDKTDKVDKAEMLIGLEDLLDSLNVTLSEDEEWILDLVEEIEERGTLRRGQGG